MRLFILFTCACFLIVNPAVADDEAEMLVKYFSQKGGGITLEEAQEAVERGLTMDKLSEHMAAQGLNQEVEEIKAIKEGREIAPKDNFLNQQWWNKAKIDDVQKELNAGANVNAQDGNGFTPLMFASLVSETSDIIELLIEKGANVNAKTNNGLTPLSFGAINPKYDSHIIETLVENGADVNAKEKDGLTPLMHICENVISGVVIDRTKVIKFLIDKGADVNARNNDGLTPLMLAVSSSDGRRYAGLLIENGADINAKDDEGRTPLWYIFGSKYVEDNVIRLMIDKGADVDIKSNDGVTPLMLACRWAKPAMIQLLVDKGADVNAKDVNGKTAKDYATSRRIMLADRDIKAKKDILKILGASEDEFEHMNDDEAEKLVNYFAQKGKTLSLENAKKMVDEGITLDSLSMMMAFAGMKQEHEDMQAVQHGGTIAPKDNFLSDKWWSTATLEDVQKEIDNGADVNAKDGNGMTPLIYAITVNKKAEIVDLLIKKGAHVNAESSLRTIFSDIKFTPLVIAVSSNVSAEIVEILLKNRADIKSFNNKLLLEASKNSNWEVVDLLLDYGADMYQEDEHEYSLMKELVSDKDTAKPEIIQQWLDRGAIIDKNILFKVNKEVSSEIIEFLVENGADVNAVDDYGYSFLMTAAYSINHDVAKTLIRLGADVEFVRYDGSTALFSALENKDIEVLKLLLENGGEAIINQLCRDETVLEKATRWKKTEYVKLLVEHGADNTKKIPAPMSKEKKPVPVIKMKTE